MKRSIISVLLALVFMMTFGSSVLAATAPDIVLLAGSNVAKTTARLNAIVTDDGGEACDVRFGYGTTTQANVAAYDEQTAWVEDVWTLGEHPYVDIDTLNANDQYFFRCEIRNADSTVASGELNFTTEAAIADPTDFSAVPNATYINLSWVKGIGSSRSLIRYAQDAEPALTTDGTLGYLGAASSYSLTGLTKGKTYYISIWGESGGGYSASYDTLVVTTTAVSAAGDDLPTPDAFPDWMMAPDATALSNLGYFYTLGNNMADAFEVPRVTYWFVSYMIVAIVIAALVYLFGHSLLGAAIALTVVLAVGTTMDLIPFWIPIAAAIFAVTIGITIHRRTAI